MLALNHGVHIYPECAELAPSPSVLSFLFVSQNIVPERRAHDTMAIRLIDTSTLRLILVVGKDPPKYATLSHTWDSSGEISFQEMMAINENPHHPAKQKPGYLKIVHTCQMARSHGISHAWVDTCCIDKTSSAELGEAINTMYRWYQEAQVCYAYLSDLDTGCNIETALPECRWFTRGWCLQELLAPKDVLFFDASWNPIGSKASLASLISDITLIDREVLVDSSLISSMPVARRMSWAANRVTTREEDMAYSLLGIFDVNMPMLYGEGSKAFGRLQEEIIKVSNDLSILTMHESSSPEIDSSHGQSLLYRSLFATSPSDFKHCGKVEHARIDVHWNNSFNLTNKGLYFRRAEMQLDDRRGLYSLPLNCEVGGDKLARMPLRKVGPNLYARCNADLEHDNGDCYTEIQNDVYIIRTITPQVQLQLEQAEKYAILVQSSSHNLGGALQVLQRSTTSDRWDSSRRLFLTRGESSFGGFWKVFPSLARKLQDSKKPQHLPSGHFYMVCGLHHSGIRSSPHAWVRLYSLEEWKDLEKKFGIVTQPANVGKLYTENTTAQIGFGAGMSRLLITAAVRLEKSNGKPLFVLELNMKDSSAA